MNYQAMKCNDAETAKQQDAPGLTITREPEFPGQVVWQCGAVLGIASDEATARADAAAICQEVAR